MLTKANLSAKPNLDFTYGRIGSELCTLKRSVLLPYYDYIASKIERPVKLLQEITTRDYLCIIITITHK
jgi:hypothetical protein